MKSYSIRQKTGLYLGIPLFVCLLLFPTPSGLSEAGHRTMSVAFLMAFWWLTEAIPIPATALIPLVAFPLLGISSAKKTAADYGNNLIFLFLGGFFLAMAIQKWGVHRRIALYIIGIIGTSSKKIVLGFMCATSLLSMWISNTATTIMMLPIALAIVTHVNDLLTDPLHANCKKNFFITLMLGTAYAASIGGIGTLIGTPPNIVFASQVKSLLPDTNAIGYLQWMLIGIPVVAIFIPVSWFILTYMIFPIKLKEIPGGTGIIKDQINSLGKMKKGEKYVLTIAISSALLWIFRRNIDIGLFVIPGWSDMIGLNKYVHDSTVAIFASLLLFAIPVNIKDNVFLLDWEWAVKVPWGLLLLFGGGIALANACKSTGLAKWVGESMTGISGYPVIIIIITTCLLMTFLTEITSNTASTTIFMPVLAATAQAINVPPLLLMIPATISASCAFMLPVATPPNAIMFGSGHITISDMTKAGIWLNLIGVVIVTAIVYVIAIPVFDIQAPTIIF